jgi:hypothetical protein
MGRKCRTRRREKLHKNYLSVALKGCDFVAYIGLYVMVIMTVIKQFVQTDVGPSDEGNNNSCSVQDRHCYWTYCSGGFE